MLTDLTFCAKQTVPNGTKFIITAKNGKDVEYEIFDYDGMNYFYHKTKNSKNEGSMISIYGLVKALKSGKFKFSY